MDQKPIYTLFSSLFCYRKLFERITFLCQIEAVFCGAWSGSTPHPGCLLVGNHSTVSPITMEVENGWKRLYLKGTHFSLNHDSGRKGKWTFICHRHRNHDVFFNGLFVLQELNDFSQLHFVAILTHQHLAMKIAPTLGNLLPSLKLAS